MIPAAAEAARKAVAIDERVADAHFALAYVFYAYEWNGPEAERESRRALQLNPGNEFARTALAYVLSAEGRHEEAIAEARGLVQRDPISAFSRFQLATMLLWARRPDEAIAAARDGLELDSGYHLLNRVAGIALSTLGRFDDAVEALRQAAALAPGNPYPQASLGWVLGLAGRHTEARAILRDLERQRAEGYVGGAYLALVHLGLGQHDDALQWLEKAAEERHGYLVYLNHTWMHEPLSSDPRYQALLRKMNFPQQ